MNEQADPRLGVGGNRPPAIPETIESDLQERHSATFARIVALTLAFDDVPERLQSDDEEGKAQDLFKQMRTIIAQAEAARKIEGEPYSTAKSTVDSTFKKPCEALAKLMLKLKARATAWLEEKRAKEQRQREEAARKEKAEADARLAAAAEAEARKREAEAAAARAAEAELEARRRKEDEERKALDARRRAREAQEAEAKAKAEAEAATAKANAAEARAAEADAKTEGAVFVKAAAVADRQADLGFQAAERSDKHAARLDRSAHASPADLSRTRGDLGTVGSLTRVWKIVSVDKTAVPLDTLRGYIHPDAIDAAVWKWLQDHRTDPGGPKLAGAVFEEVDEARIK